MTDALGAQGRSWRADVPIRLVAPAPAPATGERQRRPTIGELRQRGAQAVELVSLRVRVRELEAEVNYLNRSRQLAVENGRRIERAAAARTMNGRLPSILTGGRS